MRGKNKKLGMYEKIQCPDIGYKVFSLTNKPKIVENKENCRWILFYRYSINLISKKLFLVVEAKGYKSKDDIHPHEKDKIEYAKIFFERLQKEIPDIEIQYKMRVNSQYLGELIQPR